MNELKVFSSSEFGELGVMLIGGKEYFPATQCAKLLGYARPADAISAHCKGVCVLPTPSSGGVQNTKYIPEGDLYRLIIRSRLPAAERFERWVFDEVLPSIRKSGGYGIDIEAVIAKTATAVVSEVVKQILPLLKTSTYHRRQAIPKGLCIHLSTYCQIPEYRNTVLYPLRRSFHSRSLRTR